jgi:hypothetical protein
MVDPIIPIGVRFYLIEDKGVIVISSPKQPKLLSLPMNNR